MARFRPRGRVQANRRVRHGYPAAIAVLRRVGIVALVLVGLVSVAVGGYQLLEDPPGPLLDRAGSVIAPGSPPVAITRIPTSYRIVYRVETTSGRETTITTEELEVGRPFESRTTSLVGPPPGTARISVQATSFGALENLAGDRSKPLIIQTTPDLAGNDLRPDVDLPELLAAGLVDRREVRTVAGRACQVFRFGEPIVGGRITRYDPASDSFADECIDAAGLVLEEVVRAKGSRTRRKVATSVEEGIPVGVTVTGPFVEPRLGGGAVRDVDPTSHSPGDSYELPSPAGFTYRGRYAVVPPQAMDPNDPNARSRLVAGTADVWIRGPDVIILDQGGTLGGGAPFVEDETAPTVDAGAAGQGRLVLGLRVNQVNALVGGGHYVKLRATLPSGELRALAATLRRVTGGTGLRYL